MSKASALLGLAWVVLTINAFFIGVDVYNILTQSSIGERVLWLALLIFGLIGGLNLLKTLLEVDE